MAAKGSGLHELAARYAGGLFELAGESKALDQTAQDLNDIKQIMAESDDLRRLVRSPTLSRAEQSTAMAALLDKVGASDLVKRFIGLVAANRRLYLLEPMIDAFMAELARRRGVVTAQVQSAQPLQEPQAAALNAALKASFGTELKIDLTVNPALLGGLVVKIGSQMIDSSLRTKIDKLQHAMKAPGGRV
ncbi:MAG: F0F1 ATP synthase subunit delta [Azospirillum sp.]|nr:F0F1 ATP synthase subunit delta [Azospirillum sp.]